MICNMSLVFFFRNEGAPAWHELHILKISLLAFQLEVAVNGNVESVQKPKSTSKFSSTDV